jgi:hypothetical protein
VSGDAERFIRADIEGGKRVSQLDAHYLLSALDSARDAAQSLAEQLRLMHTRAYLAEQEALALRRKLDEAEDTAHRLADELHEARLQLDNENEAEDYQRERADRLAEELATVRGAVRP